MSKYLRGPLVAFLVTAGLTLTGGTAAVGKGAGQPGGDNSHAATMRYWTPERVARAVPRDLFIDENGKIVPQRPGASVERGKPGGGGGGSTSTVTGAPWTRGGLIQKTEGKVLFTMANTDYVCSGTVVQDGRDGYSLVLTAGHCVYDETDGWATHWMFMPAFEDAPSVYNGTFNCAILPYGCWTTTALVTSAAWGDGDLNEDYAFAVMGPGGLGGTTQLDQAVGAQAIAFSGARPASVYAFGYPHSSPYDGSDLIHCAGNTVADGWGGSTDSGLQCNMTGGSSGGGWLAPFNTSAGAGTLVSLNSFKYLAGPYKNYMFGPLFDGGAQSTYVAAGSATSTNQLVP